MKKFVPWFFSKKEKEISCFEFVGLHCMDCGFSCNEICGFYKFLELMYDWMIETFLLFIIPLSIFLWPFLFVCLNFFNVDWWCASKLGRAGSAPAIRKRAKYWYDPGAVLFMYLLQVLIFYRNTVLFPRMKDLSYQIRVGRDTNIAFFTLPYLTSWIWSNSSLPAYWWKL